MRKLTLLLLAAPAITAGIQLSATEPAAKTMLILLDDGTEIRVLGSDELTFSARGVVTHHHATDRTELSEDVRVNVMRDGAKLIEIKTQHAIVRREL